MVRIWRNAPKGIVTVIGAKGHVDVNRFIWIFWSIKFNYHPINWAGHVGATRNSDACGETRSWRVLWRQGVVRSNSGEDVGLWPLATESLSAGGGSLMYKTGDRSLVCGGRMCFWDFPSGNRGFYFLGQPSTLNLFNLPSQDLRLVNIWCHGVYIELCIFGWQINNT